MTYGQSIAKQVCTIASEGINVNSIDQAVEKAGDIGGNSSHVGTND
jgi:hypothetical protein